MLERIDNKYVIRRQHLQELLAAAAGQFDVLEIGGARCFTYETRYFDSPEFQSYCDHLRGRRKRTKVRTRRYIHSGECFLEVKLKDRRGTTIKARAAHDPKAFSRLGDADEAFVNAAHERVYGTALGYVLRPSLDVSYTRMTFVARQGGERFTLDGCISFLAGDQEVTVPKDVFIVETKSANGNSLSDKILRRLHLHPTQHCSKYCVGLSALHPDLRSNTFRPAYRRLLGIPVG